MSERSNRRTHGVAIAFATALISGLAVFVNGSAVKRFADATVYTTAKNGVAAIVLVALWAIARRDHAAVPTPRKRSTLRLALIGIVGGSVPFVLFFEGLARAQSVQAAFLHKTLILWVALLAVPLLRERITVLHIGAIALLLGGQAALTDDLAGLRFGSGEMMILGATLLWAIETVIAKRVLNDVGSLRAGAARMGFGLVVLVGWLAVSGRAGDLGAFTAEQWRWVVLTGVILAGYVATWYSALARAQAVDVTAVLVFGAVVTAVLSRGFRGVAIGPDAIGLAMVTVGAFAAAAAGRRRRLPEAVGG